MFDLTVEDRAVPQSALGRLARALNLDVPLTLGLLALCALGLLIVYSASGQDQGMVIRQALRMGLAPVLAVSLVAVFLLMMVAMGLAGVFWQSIAQRRSEIGVRRAAGATAGGVVRQIVGEVWAMVSLVVLVGLVLTAQLPLFGVAQWIGMPIFVVAVASAVMRRA